MEEAKKYLQEIGLGNAIDEEFFNDDDKSWYKVQEIMESYAKYKVDEEKENIKEMLKGEDYEHLAEMV